MKSQTASSGFLARYFKLAEKQTTVKTEILAGLTTFIALAYIIFVNPNILSEAGIPKDAAIASTIWIAALSTMVMGVVANYPVALAPGMGLNAFFAYYVCGTLGLHWTVALGAVFFSGVLFLILTVSHIRQAIINAVPQNLRVAIGVGIGLFIAFIGLKGTGLIVPDKATFIGLGHVTQPTTLLSLFGLVLTGALMARKVQGSILIGIVATTLLSMCLGYSPVPHGISDIVSTSMPHMGETFGKLDIVGAWNYGIVSIIFTFTVVELFDNMGTLIGLTSKAKLVKPNAKPLAIEPVSGIMTMVRNAGRASEKSVKLIFPTSCIMSAPTRMRGGAVAKPGTRPTSGAKISAMRKQTETVTAVSPVLPPAAMPAALSM